MAKNELKKLKMCKQDANRENIFKKRGIAIADLWNKRGKCKQER